jgi:predicted flap endonuclease-1-like 5' DNA nuclease
MRLKACRSQEPVGVSNLTHRNSGSALFQAQEIDMSGKRANSPGKRKQHKADDFKLIKGVTHSTESRLHEAKIFTLSQLAAITPANLAELIGNLEGVTEERIIEQEWIGQARILASKSGKEQVEEPSPIENMENEGFVVDLFLDDNKQVRKTQVLQVKSDEGDEWEGWDETRLINFFIQRAKIKLPLKVGQTEVVIAEAKAAIAKPIAPPLEQPANPPKVINLRSLEMIPANHQKASRLIKSGESFNVRLSFGIDDRLKSKSFEYAAFISAIKYGGNSRRVLRQIRGVINAGDDAIMVEVNRPDWQPGLYKIEAMLELSQALLDSAVTHSAITRTALQVY